VVDFNTMKKFMHLTHLIKPVLQERVKKVKVFKFLKKFVGLTHLIKPVLRERVKKVKVFKFSHH
jgi:hypothetical protein